MDGKAGKPGSKSRVALLNSETCVGLVEVLKRERERTIALIYLQNVELFLLLRTILRIDVL